jgi:hypothetical protein
MSRRIERLTDPIDMKKPNVAADESIYCDIVAIAPLGPGPPLDILAQSPHQGEHLPKDRKPSKDESNC